MTDNEIIKALEQCNKGECEGCPYGNNRLSIWDCENKLNADVLDLIKRQQSKIDELQRRNCEL